MDAEKLFNRLGFVKDSDDEQSICYTRSDGFGITVTFHRDSHSYFVSEDDPMYELVTSSMVTVALHEAITKQLEELEWM